MFNFRPCIHQCYQFCVMSTTTRIRNSKDVGRLCCWPFLTESIEVERNVDYIGGRPIMTFGLRRLDYHPKLLFGLERLALYEQPIHSQVV